MLLVSSFLFLALCVFWVLALLDFFFLLVSFGLFHVLIGIILRRMHCCANFAPFPFSGVFCIAYGIFRCIVLVLFHLVLVAQLHLTPILSCGVLVFLGVFVELVPNV